MEASDHDGMAAGARSPLTGTNFQYHLEGGCSESGRKAGEERQRQVRASTDANTHTHAVSPES